MDLVRTTRWQLLAVPAAVLAVVAWFEAPFLLDRAIVVERDALSSILPIRAFLARALHEGSWPMWNPAPVLGKPYLAEWQTGLFYPPSAFLLVPPFSRGFNLFFAFHYLWTAAGAYLLLRALGASRAGSAIGALVWTLGGPLQSLGHLLNHLMAVAWLPWVLWAWVRTDDRRAQILWSSLLLALSLSCGSPEMALLTAGLLVLVARDVRALWVPPVAALLSAAQLVPVWRYLALTHRGVHGLGPEGVLAFSTPIARLADVVVPTGGGADAFLPSLYVGPLPLALALGALLFLPSLARLLVLLVAVALLALAMGGHTAILPFLHAHVPGIGLLRYPEKLLVGFHALIAAGAAWGLTGLAARLPRRVAIGVTALLITVAVVDLARVNRGLLFTLPPSEISSPPPVARVMLDAREDARELVRYYANSTGAPVAHDPREAADLDLALLYAATGELFDLADVNTPASLNLDDHERLQRTLGEIPRDQALAVLGALGTRWITSFAPLDSPLTQRRLTTPSSAALYELADHTPRAFVAGEVAVARGPAEALERFVQAAPESDAHLAVVEGIGVDDLAYRPPARRDVRWVTRGNDVIALDVDVDAPALLVVNDTFLEGWRARVDDEPAEIERVNGLVRGVWLAAGEHRVTMTYRAPGLALGAAVSLAALVGLILTIYRGDAGRPQP